MADVVPKILLKHSNVRFIIGGDGPKMPLVREVKEVYKFSDERMEVLGALPHSEMRNNLCKGDIFLNISLTESFCIANLEAAACGLFVVSTNVGGIPEVLPPEMILMSDPDVDSICEQIEASFKLYQNFDPHKGHRLIQNLYNWKDVAKRHERVYETVMEMPK